MFDGDVLNAAAGTRWEAGFAGILILVFGLTACALPFGISGTPTPELPTPTPEPTIVPEPVVVPEPAEPPVV